MTRLIDADELLEELRKSCKYHAENSRELSLLQRDINIVKEQPTVDAIPVEFIKKRKEDLEDELKSYESLKVYDRLRTETFYYRETLVWLMTIWKRGEKKDDLSI